PATAIMWLPSPIEVAASDSSSDMPALQRLRAIDEAVQRRRVEPAAPRLGAAVDGDVVAGDEGRHVGRKEQRDPRLVLGPAEPTDRRPRRPELVGVFESGEVVDLRGL